MSRNSAIRDAIIATLRTVEAGEEVVVRGDTHTYTWSLSAEGQVRAGRYDVPEGVPFACVWWLSTQESWDSGRLGERLQQGTFLICAWARDTPQDPAQRQLDGESIAEDIRMALRANPFLGGLVRHFLANPVVFEAVDPQRPDEAVWGAAMVEIRADWVER